MVSINWSANVASMFPEGLRAMEAAELANTSGMMAFGYL